MRNKYNVTIKSIITKAPLVEKKMIETIKESTERENFFFLERERVLTFFAMNNLEGIEERGGNEVKRNL